MGWSGIRGRAHRQHYGKCYRCRWRIVGHSDIGPKRPSGRSPHAPPRRHMSRDQMARYGSGIGGPKPASVINRKVVDPTYENTVSSNRMPDRHRGSPRGPRSRWRIQRLTNGPPAARASLPEPLYARNWQSCVILPSRSHTVACRQTISLRRI
jgi:hypothetical protein